MDRPPGLRVWRWEGGLLAAFVGAVVAIAAVFLAVGFTLTGSAQVIVFVVGALLAAGALTALYVAANRNSTQAVQEESPEPPSQDEVPGQGSIFVDDKAKALSEELESVGRENNSPDREAER
jgi:ABC-type phosphate transport system substrate-binding protein